MQQAVEIVEEPIERVAEVAEVRIAFTVRTVLEVSLPEGGLGGIVLAEGPVVEPYEKDYDRVYEDMPSTWPQRFDIANWGLVAARMGPLRIGSAVLAFRTPGVVMLRERTDVAALWDLRVAPEYRGRGVGRRLFHAAEDWARQRECLELWVETQNTNVPACRFYAGQGCSLAAIDRNAYPDMPHEAQLIWCKKLA